MFRPIRLTPLGLLAASVAAAQGKPVPSTTGLQLSAYSVFASGLSVTGPFGMTLKTNAAAGFGLQVALGLTPNLLVFAAADGTKQGTNMPNVSGNMGLVHVEIGGRLSFPSAGKRIVPYLTGVFGQRGLGATIAGDGLSETMTMSGREYGAGGGFLYAFSRKLSLDAGLIVTQGKLSHLKVTGDEDVDGDLDVGSTTGYRLKVGVQWTP